MKKLVITVALCAVALSCLALAAGGANDVALGQLRVAWADAAHRLGWVADSPAQGRFRCTPRRYHHGVSYKGTRYAVAALCATSTGGKSWRPILLGASRFASVLRLSPRVAVAVTDGTEVGNSPGRIHYYYWAAAYTLDEGKNWFTTPLDVADPDTLDVIPLSGACSNTPLTFRTGHVDGRQVVLGHRGGRCHETYVLHGLTAATQRIEFTRHRCWGGLGPTMLGAPSKPPPPPGLHNVACLPKHRDVELPTPWLELIS
jgi:hypothetical protein